MKMVPFARLVIEADQAFAFHDKSEAILEGMGASANRIRNAPNDQFDECVPLDDVALVKKQGRLHVVNNANT